MVADDGELIAGHGRVLAAAMLGLKDVPVIRLSHLDEAERRAYRIADNKFLWLPPMVQEASSLLRLRSIANFCQAFGCSHVRSCWPGW
jgi:ParB-like chromosome segregation protein Spo0J